MDSVENSTGSIGENDSDWTDKIGIARHLGVSVRHITNQQRRRRIPFNRISVANNSAISSFGNAMTISCWFTISNNIINNNQWPGIVCKFSASTFTPNNGFLLRTEDMAANGFGSLYADIGGDGQAAQYQQTWNLNGATWYQCVAVATSNVTFLYLNGQLVSQGNNSGSFNSSDPLTIGGQNGTANLRLHSGLIDDVRIYSRALTSNEVAQLYAVESGPSLSIIQAVALHAGNLLVGSNYQVEASSDLTNWTSEGPAFTATNSYWQSTAYWPIANANQLFFRVVQQ